MQINDQPNMMLNQQFPSGLTVTCNTANSQALYGNVAQVLSTTVR